MTPVSGKLDNSKVWEHLGHVRERFQSARRGQSPEEPSVKGFKPKFDIPILEDYGMDEYPQEYWDAWPTYPLAEAKVESWVDVEVLKCLCIKAGIPTDSGLAKEVLADLSRGADIGATGASRLPTTGKNGQMALKYGDRVQDTLASFVSKGIYAGPLKKEELEGWNVKIHPLQIKVKDDSSVRVIVNASYPHSDGGGKVPVGEMEPLSLNATISATDFPAYMAGLGEFVELLHSQGRGALIFKADLEAAYKHIPVRQEDWGLQVLAWGDRYFVDLKLMFGTVSSAGLFDRFNRLIVKIAVNLSKIPRWLVKQYLDDVFGAEGGDGHFSQLFYNTFLSVCKEAGVRLDKSGDPKKGQPPGHTAVVLGIGFNTISWTWTLPVARAHAMIEMIKEVCQGTCFSLKQRQSLVGRLHNFTFLLPAAVLHYAFLYKWMMEGPVAEVEKLAELKEEFDWWTTAVKAAVIGLPIPALSNGIPGNARVVYTDAAGPTMDSVGRGCGLVLPDGRWGFQPWPAWMARRIEVSPVKNVSFNHKLWWMEAVGPLWALVTLGNEMTGLTMLAMVDNIGTVNSFTKGYSVSCPFLNAIIQAIKVVAEGLGTRVVMSHVYRSVFI